MAPDLILALLLVLLLVLLLGVTPLGLRGNEQCERIFPALALDRLPKLPASPCRKLHHKLRKRPMPHSSDPPTVTQLQMVEATGANPLWRHSYATRVAARVADVEARLDLRA